MHANEKETSRSKQYRTVWLTKPITSGKVMSGDVVFKFIFILFIETLYRFCFSVAETEMIQ